MNLEIAVFQMCEKQFEMRGVVVRIRRPAHPDGRMDRVPNSTAKDAESGIVPPRRTRPRDRRGQILRTAGEVFAEKGFHSASLADIAGRVGISPAALYRHFASKQHLLIETIRAGIDTTYDRVAAAADPLAEVMELALEFRGVPQLWQLEIRSLPVVERRGLFDRVRAVVDVISQAVAKRRPDISAEDARFLAWAIASIGESPSFHNVQLPRERYLRLLIAVMESVLAVPFDSPVDGAAAPKVLGPAIDDLQPERLIVAAAELFNTRGYDAVGIEDIGAAVGISGPAIYHHFASKGDLLNEIIGRNDQWIGHYISRACAEGDSAEDSLALLMQYTVAFVSRSPAIAGTALSEARHLPGEQAKRYRRVHRAGVLRWARLIQAANPDTPEDEARVRVQAITTVVIDAARNPSLHLRADFAAVLTRIGTAIALTQP
jgi:AcrR family transcriptional regulator